MQCRRRLIFGKAASMPTLSSTTALICRTLNCGYPWSFVEEGIGTHLCNHFLPQMLLTELVKLTHSTKTTITSQYNWVHVLPTTL